MSAVPSPVESAAALRAAVEEATPLLAAVSDAESQSSAREGVWCAREILGHLVDSACNNHRRFVIGPLPQTTRFEGYDQNVWVARQRYRDVPWAEVVSLWTAYNRHLAHLMACTSVDEGASSAMAPDGSGPVSVAYLMHDYVVHLRHHLDRIRASPGS